MVAKEVLTEKERILKVRHDYDEWVKKIRVLPNAAYWATVGLSIVVLLYFKIGIGSWPAIILIYLIVKSLWELAYREGHKEGYLDGCVNAGYHDTDEGVGMDD